MAQASCTELTLLRHIDLDVYDLGTFKYLLIITNKNFFVSFFFSPENKQIVAEALATQSSAKMGGVNPTQAMKAHAIAVPKIVKEVMDKVSMEAIEAVAVTNRPGLKGSLIIGRNYAQYLCYKFKKRK